uniref:Skp1-related protein n=1 Tax=Ditylenchus dipsaci TaxID=166011 RepID=A0A915CR10_9BILA
MSFDEHLKLSSSSQEVVVTTKDGDQLTVDASLLRQCKALGLTEGANQPANLTVNEVSTPIFKKVLEWCEEHKDLKEPVVQDHPITGERIRFILNNYEKKFFDIPADEIMELLTAANYLNLESMYLFGCQSMAVLLNNKSLEEVRKLLKLQDDLTEEQKEAVRKEHAWCGL